MSDGVKWKLNTTAFDRTLAEYSRVNKRTFNDIVNAKALDIARESVRLTRKADINKFTLELLGESAVTKSGGVRSIKSKKGRAFFAGLGWGNLAFRIAVGRKRHVKPRMDTAEFADYVRRFVAARRRSAAYLKSGWLGSIKKLWPYVVAQDRSKVEREGAVIRGQPKGTAKPAIHLGDSSPKAVITTTSISTKHSVKSGADLKALKVIQAGTKAALVSVMRDMQAYLDRKTKEAGAKAGITIR